MTTQIVLLRGINVGGKHIVPMKELRALMESSGYQNVRTYIQSGNIVCDIGSDLLPDVGSLIADKYGFEPDVFVLDIGTFQEAADNNPYSSDIGKTVHFFFCDPAPVNVDFDLLKSLKSPTEEYSLIGNVFYVYAPDGIGRSKLVAKMHKAFPGVTMTGRNLNTINKLFEMTRKA